MIDNYVVMSAVMFIFLALVWNKNDWANFFIKVILMFLVGYGTVLTLMQFGLVLKI